MASFVEKLAGKKIINPPGFVSGSVQYECIMGSEAYGCANDYSDRDLYGFCIPPKEYVFPHTAGEILGFSTPKYRFDQFNTEKSVLDGETSYDIQMYSIIKYFKLVTDNNPNMIDSLFVPERCITQLSAIAKLVRDKREMFLHKGLYHKFCGYAHSQMHKIKIKSPEPGSKRAASVEKYGYDVKFAYHVVRLMMECEQALTLGTIDLERDRELYKAIRRGEWTEPQVVEFLTEKENALRRVYDTNDTLPYKPDEDKITQLLLNCLEEFYGSLSNCVVVPEALDKMTDELLDVIHRYSGRR